MEIFFEDMPAEERFHSSVAEALFVAAVTTYGNIFKQHDGIKKSINDRFTSQIIVGMPKALNTVHKKILLARDTFVCHSDQYLLARKTSDANIPAIRVFRTLSQDHKSWEYGITHPQAGQAFVSDFLFIVGHVEKAIRDELAPIREKLKAITPELPNCYFDTSESSTIWLPDSDPDWVTLSKPQQQKRR
jgi:hypothetical protein